MRLLSTLVLSLSLGLCGQPEPVLADQNDPRLDPLFERLAHAPSLARGQWLERQIWSIWYQHANPSVEDLMRAGQAALEDGDLKGALIAFDDAVRKAPSYAEAWNARATANYALGNYARSLADIRRVLTLEPRHFGALSGRGLCQMELGHPEKAIAAFERSLELHPQQPGVKASLRKARVELDERSL